MHPKTDTLAPLYIPRFIALRDVPELYNLWHLSKVALAGRPALATRYDRMLWASREFAKAHDLPTPTGVYKDLDCLLNQ